MFIGVRVLDVSFSRLKPKIASVFLVVSLRPKK